MEVDARPGRRQRTAEQLPDLARDADADRVGETISSAPPATRRSASAVTRPGSTGPSNGQPNAVPSVTVARIPSSRARATIRSAAAAASSTEAFAFSRLKLSETATVRCASASPAAASRS